MQTKTSRNPTLQFWKGKEIAFYSANCIHHHPATLIAFAKSSWSNCGNAFIRSCGQSIGGCSEGGSCDFVIVAKTGKSGVGPLDNGAGGGGGCVVDGVGMIGTEAFWALNCWPIILNNSRSKPH